MEVGPTIPAGMSYGPISHSEIRSWQKNTGITLNAWESRTLKYLSSAYVAEKDKSSDPSRAAPYTTATIEAKRKAATSKNLDSLLLSKATKSGN